MKNDITNLIFSVTILTFTNFSLFAQSSKISGNVKSGEGNPIVSESIVIKGSNKGTTTDANGNFSLEINPNNTLVVSSIGYITNEIVIK
jgi:TonB-dependent starch-binding outer membrane protein SusC